MLICTNSTGKWVNSAKNNPLPEAVIIPEWLTMLGSDSFAYAGRLRRRAGISRHWKGEMGEHWKSMKLYGFKMCLNVFDLFDCSVL